MRVSEKFLTLNGARSDAAAPNRAAMCDNGYASVLNSLLLKQAGITKDTPQPRNGKISKDEHGEPTGAILGAPDLLSRFRQNRQQTHSGRMLKGYPLKSQTRENVTRAL